MTTYWDDVRKALETALAGGPNHEVPQALRALDHLEAVTKKTYERAKRSEELLDRIRAGIDWGRSGPWPPDAVVALEELRSNVTQSVTSVDPDSDDPKSVGIKPEEDQKTTLWSPEANQ